MLNRHGQAVGATIRGLFSAIVSFFSSHGQPLRQYQHQRFCRSAGWLSALRCSSGPYRRYDRSSVLEGSLRVMPEERKQDDYGYGHAAKPILLPSFLCGTTSGTSQKSNVAQDRF